MDEQDSRFSASDTLPPELESLDAWLRHDGERWRVRVPSHDALSTQARALTALAPSSGEPPQLPNLAAPAPDASGRQRHLGTPRRGRFPAVLATIAAVLIVALMLVVVRGATSSPTRVGTSVTPNATVSPAATQMSTATTATVPFTVTSVDLAVNPTSIAGTACGSPASFTYTATFHIPAHTAGGAIQYAYTLNNGRSQTAGTVMAGPGETSKTVTFVSSGTLTADHTYPGVAIVMVTGPSSIASPPVKPSGTCVPTGPSAAFQVTAVSMTVNPTSIAGTRCGTSLTVTYTATFHVAPNGPGGTIQFDYTVNNGRGSNPASIAVPPGATTARYTFQWSGTLPGDHTYPEPGGVIVQSPNAINSPLLGPSGTCS